MPPERSEDANERYFPLFRKTLGLDGIFVVIQINSLHHKYKEENEIHIF